MNPEFILWVENLPENDRRKFLDAFHRCLYSSKLSFEPPFKWNLIQATTAEHKAIMGNDHYTAPEKHLLALALVRLERQQVATRRAAIAIATKADALDDLRAFVPYWPELAQEETP